MPELLSEEAIIVRSFVSVMSEGITFQLILADGRSKTVRLFVDDRTLTWRNTVAPYAGGVLQMAEVTRVVDGYPAHMDGLITQEEQCCFTVETRRQGSLVFSAFSPVEREAVVEGFSLMLDLREGRKTPPLTPTTTQDSVLSITTD